MNDGDTPGPEGTQEQARRRLAQVFHFLRELNDLRNPTIVHVDDYDRRKVLWLDALPDHPSVRRATVERATPDEEAAAEALAAPEPGTKGDDFVLRVGRPKTTSCPPPPEGLRDWLQAGWDHPDGLMKCVESRNETVDGNPQVVRFDEEPERSRLLDEWQALRDKWAENERPVRQALRVFEQLYEWHGIIERESDRLELVLGDGLLRWDRTPQALQHPVLLQRLQLEFDADKPEFTLRDTDHSPELYMPLFRAMEDVDGQALGRCREDLTSGAYHPLEDEATSGFLRRLVQVLLVPSGGEFEPNPEAVARTCPRPVVARRPAVFLRNRTSGFGTAIDTILEDLPNRKDIPQWFKEIVGVVPTPQEITQIVVIEPEDSYGRRTDRMCKRMSAHCDCTRPFDCGRLCPPLCGRRSIRDDLDWNCIHSDVVLPLRHYEAFWVEPRRLGSCDPHSS